MISTSLAMALGFSVASAVTLAGKPQITINNSGGDQSNALGIVWNGLNGGDLLNQPAQTGGSDPFSQLNFIFSDTGSGASHNISGSVNTITVSGSTGQSIVLGGTTSGIQINDGTGTLNIDFGSANVANTFTLDLSGVQNTSGAYAFKGNITTSGKNYVNTRYFKAIFGASVKGDLTLNSGGNSRGANAITFKNGANLEGNLTAGYEDTDIIFETGGKITGNVKKISSGALNITFRTNGTIDGQIFSNYLGTANIGGDNLTLNGDVIVENLVENGKSFYGGANNIVFSGTNGTIGNDGTSGQAKNKVNLTVATNKNGAYPNVSGHNAIIANATNNTFTLGKISLGGSYAPGRPERTHNIISLNTSATNNTLTADSLSSGFGYTFIGKDIVITDTNNSNAITYNNNLFDSPTSRDPVVKSNISTIFMADTYMAKGTFTIGDGSGDAVLATKGGNNYLNVEELQINGKLKTLNNGTNTIRAQTLTISGEIKADSGQNYIHSSGDATLGNITAINNSTETGGGRNYIVMEGTSGKIGDGQKATIKINMQSTGVNYSDTGYNVIVTDATTNTFNIDQLALGGSYGGEAPKKNFNILSFSAHATSNIVNIDSLASGFGSTIIGGNAASKTGFDATLFANSTDKYPALAEDFVTTFMSNTHTAKGTFTVGTGSGNAIVAGEGAGNYLNVESLIINGGVKTTSSGVNYLYAGKKLTISNGVVGHNSLTLEAGDSTQNTSVIKNIVTDDQGSSLGVAFSGNGDINLNVANSQLGAGVTAIEGYLAASISNINLATAKQNILNSSVIAGSIVSSGNTNIKIVGTQNTTTRTPTDKAQIGILGNINNSNKGVVFNAIMQDAFFAPTEFLVKDNNGKYQQPISFGGAQAGTITTGVGASTTIITRFTNPVVNSSGISMYGLDVGQNSTTNIAIQGNINVGTYIDYEKGSTINLIFANANNMVSDSASDSFQEGQTDLTGNGSQLLGVTYQDGVKLALADKTVLIGDAYASFLDTYASYYTDGTTPLATVWAERTNAKDTVGISGLVVGDIYSLASSGGSITQKTYDVTLESGSAFVGKIKLDPSTTSAINIVMKENSKLILSDNRDGTATDTFVISSLEIQGKDVDPYQLQMETLKQTNNIVNLASGGASPNNVKERENFRLLTVGNATAVNTPATSGGLSGDGKAVFMTYVNTNADQQKATLGHLASSGKKSLRAGGVVGNGQYGNIYSDRIIIANIGDNQTAKSGDYYMQFAVDANSKLGNVTYNASNDVAGNHNGGVKTEGNIAVLTVVNTADRASEKNKGGINLKTQDVLQGFDRIGGDLIAVQTDINGVYDSNGAYTTYFINRLATRGATEATQEVTASVFATNYDLYLANFNSLNKRMGELRDNANSQGVWARVFSGAQSNDFSKSKNTYTTVQGGYDYALGFEGANNYIGLAVAYSMSSTKSDLNATDINGSTKGIEDIKSSAVEVAVYNSYVQDEGWYNDSIFKFSYIMSDFKMIGQTSNYSTNNMAFTLSDEFGYRFKLGEAKEWYIDPQLELAFGYFNQSDFVQTLGLSSLDGVADSIYTTRARFGSSFGYDFKQFTENKPIKASVYVGAFYEYDFVAGGDVTLTTNLGGETVSSSVISSDGRVVVNVGTNMTIKDNTRIYFDFETSFAGKIRTDYQANVGVRYSFGENAGYTPLDPNKKTVAPLKVSDEKTQESKESVENTNSETKSEATTEQNTNSTENKAEEKAQ